MENIKDCPVDFVVTWVDGADEKWLSEKRRYEEISDGKALTDSSDVRYRTMHTLRYWFRGVEKFAPWVRKVFFVTCGQKPEWLNEKAEKLVLISHSDFMPSDALPTFNSAAIEVYLHRIPELSERFVYFNDDMFLTAPVGKEHFFKGGVPAMMLCCQPVPANPKNPVMSMVCMNSSLALSKAFDKRAVMKKYRKNFFHIGYPLRYYLYNIVESRFPQMTGFYTPHKPVPFLKSTFEEVWRAEEKSLDETGHSRFREGGNMVMYLFAEWQKLSGHMAPVNEHKGFSYFEIEHDIERIVSFIEKQKGDTVCINDNPCPDFEERTKRLREAFQKILPEKSSFEL